MNSELYQKKLRSPDEAVQAVKSKDYVGLPMAISQPPALMQSLANHLRAERLEDVRLYYMHGEEAMKHSLMHPDLLDHAQFFAFAFTKEDRKLLDYDLKRGKKRVHYVPASLSQVPEFFLKDRIHLNVFMITVSPMDEHGYFSYGLANDYSRTAAQKADILIVEVNKHMPRVMGDSTVHISDVDMVVENHMELQELPFRKAKPEDEMIARLIYPHIVDGTTLQIGNGGVPDQVCRLLTDRNDLGLHTELMTDGLAKLIQSGNITGKRKNINVEKHVFTLCYGTRELYDFLDDNQAMESYPSNYVNHPSIIAKNDKVVSICGALEIDIFGQVNAETVNGRQVGGPGGQNDFVRGARMSKGGKSFLVLPSTAKNGTISRIVPKGKGFVTDTRMDIEYVATEYGCVNLDGLSTSERANALISIAHPKFREDLTKWASDNFLF